MPNKKYVVSKIKDGHTLFIEKPRYEKKQWHACVSGVRELELLADVAPDLPDVGSRGLVPELTNPGPKIVMGSMKVIESLFVNKKLYLIR